MPTFEELSDLAQFVKPNKIKDLVIVGTTSNPTSKLDQLYHGLTHGHFLDDAMAAEQVLGCAPRDAAYYKLKERLHGKLLTTLLFFDIDNKEKIERSRAFHSCLRQLHAGKILLINNRRQSAIPLLKQGLKIAEKFEFTELALSFARDLRTHYGTITGEQKPFWKYDKLVKIYLNLLNAELKAEQYYGQIIMHYVFSEATKSQLLDQCIDYYFQLREITQKSSSFRLNFISFLLFILRYEIVNDYLGTLKVCHEAISIFSTPKHTSANSALLFFNMKMLAAQIRLKNYKQAEKTAMRCFTLTPKIGTNFFVCSDYYIILAFHMGNYQKAYSIYLSVFENPGFRRQYDHIKERWKIQEAFIQYFIITKKISPQKMRKPLDFKLNRFLNEVPFYSRDKTGTNTIILILHILFLLHQQKYSIIIDRVESLKTYSHRYLRQDDTFRSNCFIKMLLQLPAASFHKKGVIRKAKKYWDKLQTVPLEKANQSVELEIVPYETLWEFVLDSLDNKFH